MLELVCAEHPKGGIQEGNQHSGCHSCCFLQIQIKPAMLLQEKEKKNTSNTALERRNSNSAWVIDYSSAHQPEGLNTSVQTNSDKTLFLELLTHKDTMNKLP